MDSATFDYLPYLATYWVNWNGNSSKYSSYAYSFFMDKNFFVPGLKKAVIYTIVDKISDRIKVCVSVDENDFLFLKYYTILKAGNYEIIYANHSMDTVVQNAYTFFMKGTNSGQNHL